MSTGAPTGRKVKKTGGTVMTKCQSAMRGICIADPNGPCHTYLDQNTNQQEVYCPKCFEQLVLARQIVEVK